MKSSLLTTLMAKPQRPPASVMSLFANGEKGIILIPKFTRYMFQDAAMTIPAVVGMPVVKAVCPATGVVTTFANVTLKQDSAGLHYLEANGTSSAGQTTAIDFTGTDKMTVFAGVHRASDAAYGTLFELGHRNLAEAGSFTVAAPDAALPRYAFVLEGTSIAQYRCSTGTSAAPKTDVLSASFDIGAAAIDTEIIPRINGSVVQEGAVGADVGTGNFSSLPLNIFARNNGSVLFMNGRLYGAVIRGAASTAGQIADVTRLMAGYSGVNL